MTLSFEDTKALIFRLLDWKIEEARLLLHQALAVSERTEAEFYAGIVEHGPTILTSDQWVELLSRLPIKLLWSQLDLDRILSKEQRRKLPSPRI